MSIIFITLVTQSASMARNKSINDMRIFRGEFRILDAFLCLSFPTHTHVVRYFQTVNDSLLARF